MVEADAVLIYIGECGKKQIYTKESKVSREDLVRMVEMEFMWCSDCREMFHRSDKNQHKGRDLFPRLEPVGIPVSL